jgi:antitoxin MazE
MKTKVHKWGNSLAVRIPKALVMELGLENETPVEIDVQNEILEVKPISKQYKLEDLLKGVTKRNRHPEYNLGEPVGKEVW